MAAPGGPTMPRLPWLALLLAPPHTDWPLVDREDRVYGMFDADPAGVAAQLRELLDR